MPCRTVLVIPCYNEAARLRPERFRAFLSAHPEVSLLFVDDGSTDGTAEALGGFEVLRLARNRGKGEAVRQGVLHCLSSGRAPDYIGFLDADLAVAAQHLRGPAGRRRAHLPGEDGQRGRPGAGLPEALLRPTRVARGRRGLLAAGD